MNNRNSEIIISKNIKLDKNYINVLDYSEQEMVELCRTNAVASSNTYSFIKQGTNVIDTHFSYNDGLKANYVAFQNPNYSNKWFFAFIDDVEYISNGCARLHFTIDVHSTWFSYWDIKPCFIVREHVTDDTVGLHTIPEGLETGEYITESIKESSMTEEFYICFGVSKFLSPLSTLSPAGYYNNIFSGVAYIVVDSIADGELLVQQYANDGIVDNIESCFIIPKTGVTINSWYQFTSYIGHSWGLVESNDLPIDFGGILINNDDTLNGYVPKNNKLLTFPYRYLLLSNNAGGSAIYHYELFKKLEVQNQIALYGSIGPGCNIKAVPLEYKGVALNLEESLSGAKLPVCSWASDVYTNWLTQNSINNTVNLASSVASIITGDTSKGITGIINTAGQFYQHSLVPYQTNGNTNVSDVLFAMKHCEFRLYHNCIREEYAKMIDDVFTRTGYLINKIKNPNLTSRPFYNFVKIGNNECIGYPTNSTFSVPSSSMELINNIYRNGVTVWHNHVHVGNYAVDNSIQ